MENLRAMKDAFADPKQGALTFQELLARIGLPSTGAASKSARVTREHFTAAVKAYCGNDRYT